MRNIKQRLVRSLKFLSVLVFLNMSMVSPNHGKVEFLQSEVSQLNRELVELRGELKCRESEVHFFEERERELERNPLAVAELLLKDEDAFVRRVKDNLTLPGTVFKVEHSFVQPKIDPKLLAALVAFSQMQGTPKDIVITSIQRTGNSRSKHFTGKAIDLKADNKGKRFIEWLDTEDGKGWLREHNLKFFIEDNQWSRFLNFWVDTSLEDTIFLNHKATGPHVHLQLEA